MKEWKLRDRTAESTKIVGSGNSKCVAWMQEFKRHQGIAGMVVTGGNLIEMIETERK